MRSNHILLLTLVWNSSLLERSHLAYKDPYGTKGSILGCTTHNVVL